MSTLHKKYMSCFLVLVIIALSIQFGISSATEAPEGMEDVNFTVGEQLVDLDFTSGSITALPEGWSVEKPQNSTAWNGNENLVTAFTDQGLSISSYNGDGMVFLPVFNADNYVYEVQTVLTAGVGSFGILDNVPADLTNGAVKMLAYVKGNAAGDIYYNQNKFKTGAVDTAQHNHPFADINMDAPTVNTSWKFTVYGIGSKNYFYINGVLASIFEKGNFNAGASRRTGLIACGASFAVSKVTLKKLNVSSSGSGSGEGPGDEPGDDPGPGSGNTDSGTVGSAEGAMYVVGNAYYANDFSKETVGALPEGWQKAYTGNGTDLGWGAAGGRSMTGQIVNHATYGKCLAFGSNNTDAFLSMPEIPARNYVFEAKVAIDHPSTLGASIGLANNMWNSEGDNGGILNADGVLHAAIYTNGATGVHRARYRYIGSGKDLNYDTGVPNPKSGETVTLKFVCLNGFTYIYVGNQFVGKAEQRAGGSNKDWVGFYTYAGYILIREVAVRSIDTLEVKADSAELQLSDNKVNLAVGASFDKSSVTYKENYSGDYHYADDTAIKFGMVVLPAKTNEASALTVETPGAQIHFFKDSEITQNAEKLTFQTVFSNIPKAQLDQYYNVRAFALVGGNYFYGTSIGANPANLANGMYLRSEDDALKKQLDTLFAGSEIFIGKDAAKLTFTLFSDFHYKEGGYISTMSDMRAILKRAEDTNSDFVLSAGDMCNDFLGSPELLKTLYQHTKQDGTIMPAYNVYGNHELESAGNSMEVVTPTLTNDSSVVWGTADGKMDTSIGYYYFERNGFRIVALDSQYSYNPTLGEWEHSHTASWGPPAGNKPTNALGPVQLAWLEKVLTDAAKQKMPCIVVAHDGFSGLFATSSSDAAAVRAIFKKVNALRAGTVLMCINGHLHTNHQGYNEGVFYLDMNTTRNNWWQANGVDHYTDDMTYPREWYDEEGNLLRITDEPVNSLGMGRQTWFSADPISTVVTINEYGEITLEGTQSDWLYGVLPPDNIWDGIECWSYSGTYWDCNILGHDMQYFHNDQTHWSKCRNDDCNVQTAPEAHTYDQKVMAEEFLASPASCTGKVTYYKSCVCGKAGKETFTGDALPHTADNEWHSDQNQHWHECQYGCGTKLDLKAHVFDQRVATDAYKASDASCDKKATYYYSCVCGQKGTDTFEGGLTLDHVTEIRNAKEATCKENGYTGDTYCKVCQQLLQKGSTIDKDTNHHYGEWTVKKAATSTETGLRERTCSICGNVQSEEIPKLADGGASDNTGTSSNTSSNTDSGNSGAGNTDTDTSSYSNPYTPSNYNSGNTNYNSGNSGYTDTTTSTIGGTNSGTDYAGINTDNTDHANTNTSNSNTKKSTKKTNKATQAAATDDDFDYLWIAIILVLVSAAIFVTTVIVCTRKTKKA